MRRPAETWCFAAHAFVLVLLLALPASAQYDSNCVDGDAAWANIEQSAVRDLLTHDLNALLLVAPDPRDGRELLRHLQLTRARGTA